MCAHGLPQTTADTTPPVTMKVELQGEITALLSSFFLPRKHSLPRAVCEGWIFWSRTHGYLNAIRGLRGTHICRYYKK